MRFPAPLRPGATIGVTAPSTGVPTKLHARLDLALQHLRNQGYVVKEGQCLRQINKGASASKEKRAQEFMDFWLDAAIAAIIPPWGGVFAIDVLPLLDWTLLQQNEPKWLLGYSDISTLAFALTLRTGIATAHGTNLMEMLPRQSDRLTLDCLLPLALDAQASLMQKSGEFFQKNFPAAYDDPFHLTEKVAWKTLDAKSVSFSGRLIGGCLDTLSTLVGTSFSNFASFDGKDGIILYLESDAFSPTDQYRYLWTLKEAGWFHRLNGLLLGRSANSEETNPEYFQYQDLIEDFFRPLNIPLIYDVDIGHRQPNMTLINGAFAEVHADGRGAGTVKIWRK